MVNENIFFKPGRKQKETLEDTKEAFFEKFIIVISSYFEIDFQFLDNSLFLLFVR